MTDVKKFLDAVTEMRAAQKLEMDALPSNFKVWKKTRQQMTVARLEAQVDALLEEMQRASAVESQELAPPQISQETTSHERANTHTQL